MSDKEANQETNQTNEISYYDGIIKCSDGTSIGLLKINGNDTSELTKLGINIKDYATNSDKTISIYPNLKDNIQLIIIGNPITVVNTLFINFILPPWCLNYFAPNFLLRF